MDNRRGVIIGIVMAAVCVIAVGTSYIYVTPKEVTDEESVIRAVVTILPQADFVENIGGKNVTVTVLVPPGASPHTYESTPGQLREVSRAQIYFKVGSGVQFEEAWMDKILGVNPNMVVVDCADGIMKMDNDPHIWNSPSNAKVMVRNICDSLIEIDPGHKEEYTANRDRYLQELDEVDAYIHERLDPYTRNRVFMIYHPAFGYFAADYNLTQLSIEHEGKTPTPKVIQDCIEYARHYNLSYVYAAPQFATKDAEMIAHEIGGQTVFIDPLPRDYSAAMRSTAASLALEVE